MFTDKGSTPEAGGRRFSSVKRFWQKFVALAAALLLALTTAGVSGLVLSSPAEAQLVIPAGSGTQVGNTWTFAYGQTGLNYNVSIQSNGKQMTLAAPRNGVGSVNFTPIGQRPSTSQAIISVQTGPTGTNPDDSPTTCKVGTGRLCDFGTVTIKFNQPVTNPIFNVGDIGGSSVRCTGGTCTDPANQVVAATTAQWQPSIASASNAGAPVNATFTKLSAATNPDGTDQPIITQGGKRLEDSNTFSDAGCAPNVATDSGRKIGAQTGGGCGSFVVNGTLDTLVLGFEVATQNRVGAGVAAPEGVLISFDTQQDYGDAPASYDAGNAAYATVGPLTLGSTSTVDAADKGIDPNANIAASPNAGAAGTGDSDDAFGPAGPPSVNISQPNYTVTVPVSGVTAAGQACGWIDFNKDGAFQANERACAQLAPGATTAQLSFAVPAGTTAGSSFMRLRVGYNPATGTNPATSPTGGAGVGEVEDWPIALASQKIGDTVFNDTNQNGVQDAGEPGVNGVKVELLDSNDAVVATTTTANVGGVDGIYSFDAEPGQYKIRVTPPAGAGFTTKGTDPAADKDSNINPPAQLGDPGTSDAFTVAAGVDNLTIDAGLVFPKGTLSGTIWTDGDGNRSNKPAGAPDTSLAGITVALLDQNGNPVNGPDGNPLTQTTDANGNYSFANIPVGSYKVKVNNPPANTVPTYSTDTAGPGNDGNPATATPGTTSGVITVAKDQTTGNVNFSFVAPASIGDTVFQDTNANGVLDGGETGVAGVTVTLTDENGQPVKDLAGNDVAAATTDANGKYNFGNLAPGLYKVKFAAPAGQSFTVKGTDPAADNDSNANPDGTTDVITLTAGTNNNTVDAGLVPTSSVGDTVFVDNNGNGTKDAGEPGLAGATVVLKDANGAVVGTQTTDANGKYLFTNVPPGQGYTITVTPPTADKPYKFSPTTPPADGQDTSVVSGTGVSQPFAVELGKSQLSLDAGVYQPATIGDTVFQDADSNGTFDNGEPTVPGVTVALLDGNGQPAKDADGNPVAPVTTGADGKYSFGNLAPGSYQVKFTAPAGTVFTTKGTDPAADNDSNANPDGSTAPVTLTSGQDNNTVDAGLIKVSSIGDLVFQDKNGNGVFDDGDTPVQGVKISLLDGAGQPAKDANGQPVPDQTTGADGKYSFGNLLPGNYKVKFTAPDGLIFTSKGTDPAADNNSNANPDGVTDTIELGQGQTNNTVDAGLVEPATIGDTVFTDLNGNGTLDPGETGVPGVTVALVDNAGNTVQTVTTDADGKYSFTNVVPGTYTVKFTAPDGSKFTKKGTDPAADNDSNPNPDGTTDPVTVAPGQVLNTVDAGLIQPTSIGDLVFEDTNGNGVKDADEPGIAGAKVELLNADGSPAKNADGADVAPITTGADGKYSFDNLAPGSYKVKFTGPDGTVFTSKGTDPAADNDSNANPDGTTDVVTLTSGTPNNTVDAGLVKPVTIGDTVFTDVNGNGVQDDGEPGLPGVKVDLLDKDGNVVATTTTDPNGEYSFTNVVPGTYSVKFTAPDGSFFTKKGTDPAADKDSNPNPNGQTDPFTVVSGVDNKTIDAGLVTPASLGNQVFEDTNGNGQLDDGEPGVAGVKVELLNADGTPVTDLSGQPVAAQTTGADGKYSFGNLAPGSYKVKFTGPEGTKFTSKGTDPAADNDSNANPDGTTDPVTLASGEQNNTVDAGLFKPATIGDSVFEDKDGNGVKDPTDPGVPGVTVQLLDKDGNPVKDADGNPVADQVTNADGTYSFSNLVPGTYTVKFIAPEGTKFTKKGTDPAADNDSNANPDGTTAPVTVAPGQVLNTVDAGLVKPTSIGDLVFEDTNGNGVKDADEAGIAGAKVELLNADGSPAKDVDGADVAPITTGAEGKYSFDNLAPGSYKVKFTAPDGTVFTKKGTDPAADNDSNANPDGTSDVVTLTSGTPNNTIDAGVFKPVTIGDTVFTDVNGNGVQDDGEPGLAGVKVDLLDKDGNVVATTTSGPNGEYSFTNVVPGTYSVKFTAPDGSVFTPKGTDPAADKDSNPNPNGQTDPFTVVSGVDNKTIDAGLVTPATIGNQVFQDTNGNGVQDEGEPGLPGVKVELLNADGTPVTDLSGQPVPAQTTGADGKYSFGNLAPGNYKVKFTGPEGTKLTAKGTDPAKDGDSNPNPDGTTDPVTLNSGMTDNTVDAGFFKPATIGNQVFEDKNGNGVKDPTDPGVPGVTVQLVDKDGNPVKDADGNPVADQVTNADGVYSFTNLVPGAYTVKFIAPDGTKFTKKGTDPAADNDSNPNPNGSTDPITVDSGAINNTVDAGVFTPASIGSTVFDDKNGNGVRDADEPGIPGATVTLLDKDGQPAKDADGNPVQPITTGPDGQYNFTNLPPGDYQVSFKVPDGKVLTQPKQGTDPNKDSDAVPSPGNTSGIAKVTVASGDAVKNIDAGVVPPATIGDTVFLDRNGNGVKDPGEPGIPGVKVELLDKSGKVVATTTSGPDGKYSFTNVIPGTYSVKFTAPTGMVFVKKGTDPAADNDSNADLKGATAQFTVAPGEVQNTIDAGLANPVGSLTGTVYDDRNGNNKQDPGEPGLPGVTVILKNSDGKEIARTKTDAKGNYIFTNVPAGDGYTVTVTGAPAGSKPTQVTGPVSVLIGQTTTNVDFGFVPAGVTPVTPPKPNLPDTGANGILPMGIGAALFMLAGASVLWFTRRRRA
ncbi:SdrD B-like domain-containing protein [Psychromicrobium sp. YIM B11713]|uniref:SdrD B-like domain-containing protein n=1 Tax=Psychromicrobium sp. YIM B11713 TaxID=3145233 RepID=UPI00374E7688